METGSNRKKKPGSNRRLGPDLCPPELRFDPFPWPLILAGIVSALEKVKGENWAEFSGASWGLGPGCGVVARTQARPR